MTLKIPSLAFLLCLALAHAEGGALVASQPLSMLRDGDLARLGYLAFTCLLVVGLAQAYTLARAGRLVEMWFAVAATALLFLIAITPTGHPIHETAAFLLLGLLYAYYACLLLLVEGRWLALHLSVPVWVLLVTNFDSFGVWQKTMIVYFVLASNVQCHVLVSAGKRRLAPVRRRKVFQVQDGRAWMRQKQAAGSTV